MAYNYMKKISTSLSIIEMKIKTVVIVHLTTVRIAITKYRKNKLQRRIWGCGIEFFYTASGNAN